MSFTATALIGFFLGFVFGVGCALAVMYSIYFGGYRAAIRDSLLPDPPQRFHDARERATRHATKAEPPFPLPRPLTRYMTKQADDAIRSGAQHVDQTEQLATHRSAPRDVSALESQPEERLGEPPIRTELTNVTLSMFEQGNQVRVRVGNAHNASELYEHIFSSADEANTAMLEGDILSKEQVPDPTALAGTNVSLIGVTAEKLLAAGLKRRGADTL